MNIFKSALYWTNKIIEKVLDFLIPESQRVQKLLYLDESSLYQLLPKSPVKVKDLFVLFDYGNGAVKLLVKSVKYKNNRSVKRRLASYLYDCFLDISEDVALFDGAPPILIPMPMSKMEKSKKGFNQCEELAREMENISGKNIEVAYDVLQKIKETKRQTTLSKEERMENIKGSMRVFLKSEATAKIERPELIEGESLIKNRSIVVLDDVYTTLSTFSEARRALSAAGAKAVYGLFLAH